MIDSAAYNAELGKRIRSMRLRRAMKQSELAEKCGCAASQISRYESGAYSVEASTLARIALALACPMAKLTDGIKA